jgi:hypothetical protein
MTYDYIAENKEYGIAAYVYCSGQKCGGYAVMYKDEDSGNAIASDHGLTLESAISKANEFVA